MKTQKKQIKCIGRELQTHELSQVAGGEVTPPPPPPKTLIDKFDGTSKGVVQGLRG